MERYWGNNQPILGTEFIQHSGVHDPGVYSQPDLMTTTMADLLQFEVELNTNNVQLNNDLALMMGDTSAYPFFDHLVPFYMEPATPQVLNEQPVEVKHEQQQHSAEFYHQSQSMVAAFLGMNSMNGVNVGGVGMEENGSSPRPVEEGDESMEDDMEEEEAEEEIPGVYIPKLVHPKWEGNNGTSRRAYNCSLLSDKAPATFGITMPRGQQLGEPRHVSLDVQVEVMDEDGLQVEEVKAVHSFNGVIKEEIPNQRQQQRTTKSRSKSKAVDKKAPQFTLVRKNGVTEVLEITFYPVSYRLRVHNYRFQGKVVTQAGIEHSFSLQSYPTTTYTHVTQHAHKQLKKVLPFHFCQEQEVPIKDIVATMKLLHEVNQLKGFRKEAFAKFPVPDVGTAAHWPGTEMPAVVDWLLSSCQALEVCGFLFDQQYLHGGLPIIEVEALLRGHAVGTFLIRLGLDGLVISYVNRTEKICHTMVESTPSFIESVLQAEAFQTIILREKVPVLRPKAAVLAAIAGECPLKEGYSLPWDRPQDAETKPGVGAKRKRGDEQPCHGKAALDGGAMRKRRTMPMIVPNPTAVVS